MTSIIKTLNVFFVGRKDQEDVEIYISDEEEVQVIPKVEFESVKYEEARQIDNDRKEEEVS